MTQLHQGKTFQQLLETVERVDPASPKYMKKVIGYEYRSNNSSQHTVARLECGHERVFEYGTRVKMGALVRCWECPKLDEPCETCSSEREITVRGSESDHTDRIPCPDCRRKQ